MSTTIEAIMRHIVPHAKREPARKASAIVIAQKQSGSNELARVSPMNDPHKFGTEFGSDHALEQSTPIVLTNAC